MSLSFSVFLFFLLIPLTIYFLEYTPVTASQEKIIYNLPYPGILPDNPLYPLKIVRDRIIEWTTRDNLKKAEFYLITSDKRVAMAMALAKKGKDKLAIETLVKGEKYSLQIPPLIINAKKQGAAAPSEFIQTLRLSNAKHLELAQELLKELPQGQVDLINQAVKINGDISRELAKL